jgi:biotin carboxylase
MMGNPVAIVLGGTAPHIELIRQLKERGYKVVLVDYLPNPPAKKFADVHEQVSTLDNEAVLKVAKQYGANLVISACVDQANITACYVAEKMGLPHPYSYQLASDITNKGFMKRVMWDNAIPTTRFVFLGNGEELGENTLRFPVMVKPADSCAASGVKKANDAEELAQFLAEAKKVSRTGRTVIEEFFSGVEVSVYAFVKQKEANILMIAERLSTIEGENQVLKCYATITPPNITEGALQKIEFYTTKIAQVFSLDNTPLHVQFICDGDKVSVIEFAPRVGGGISYKNIKNNTGFDIISATIDSYLQKPVDMKYSRSGRYFSVNLAYGIPAVFDHLDGVEPLIENGCIDSIHYHKTKGATLTADRASGGRIAAILVSGGSRQEVLEKVRYVFENINAFDDKGNQILRKDLYIRQ